MTDKTNQENAGSGVQKPAHSDVAHNKTANSNESKEDFTPLAQRFYWAESSTSVERVIFWLGVTCAILFVVDFFGGRHSYAPGEGIPGFYAFVGFAAFALIVLGATQLRRLILRKEDFYAPHSTDAEEYPESGLEKLQYQKNAADVGEEHKG